MTFYLGTLVELLIVEAFVFFIWLGVMRDAIGARSASLASKKLVLTSVGLVITSLAIFGIIGVRVAETYYKFNSLYAVNGFYVMLAVGSALFIIAAAIDKSFRMIWLFAATSFMWTAVYLYWTFV